MAFVTYVIISSVIYGLRGRFHPEILGYTASRALAIVLIELSAMKLGCYLLNIQGDHTIVDLLAYSGYKFVGTILVLCVGMLGWSRWLYWIAFLYVFAANAFFLVRAPVCVDSMSDPTAALPALRCPAGPGDDVQCHGHPLAAHQPDPVPLWDRRVPDRIRLAADRRRILIMPPTTWTCTIAALSSQNC